MVCIQGCREFVNYREKSQTQTSAPRLVGVACVIKSGCGFNCASQLAKYCDQLLRKGTKGNSESDLEDHLDDVVSRNLITSDHTWPMLCHSLPLDYCFYIY